MGSMPGLTDLLPLVSLMTGFDQLSLNVFGSLSDSLGVEIPEAPAA